MKILKKSSLFFVGFLMVLGLFVLGQFGNHLVAYGATEWVAPGSNLEDNEETVMGKVGQGSIIDRVSRIDNLLVGVDQTGAVTIRIQKQTERLRGGSEENLSIIGRLNGAEWSLDRKISNEPLIYRITDLESRVTGKLSNYSLETRSKEIAKNVVDTSVVAKVTIPTETLIWVEFIDPVSSESAQVGSIARFKVAEDVWVNNYLVFPKGALGKVRVEEIVKAKKFARNGKLVLSIEYLEAIDGTRVQVLQGDKSIEATASYGAGVSDKARKNLILGSLGAVKNAFFSNSNAVIKTGDQFYLQTEGEHEVISIQL